LTNVCVVIELDIFSNSNCLFSIKEVSYSSILKFTLFYISGGEMDPHV